MMKENEFHRGLANKSMGVYFDASEARPYDGGREENLTFNGTLCYVGGGFDADTGITLPPAVPTFSCSIRHS